MVLMPGFFFPNSLCRPVIGSFFQPPILSVHLASNFVTHLTSEPCLRTLRTICRILFASLIIVSSTRAGITRIPPTTDNKELSRTKITTRKSRTIRPPRRMKLSHLLNNAPPRHNLNRSPINKLRLISQILLS